MMAACALMTYGCGVAESTGSQAPGQKPTPAPEAQTVAQQPLKGAGNPDCPAMAWLVKSMPSKPPLTFYQFKIRLMNRQARPSWFVLRYRDPLASSGRFTCYEKHCFSAGQLSEGNGESHPKVVVTNFLSSDSFTAIRLPEGGDITLGEYILNTAEPVSEFEVWEVDSLLVNGKTPLEEWLPYPVMSDRLVRIGRHAKKTSLDWDRTINNYRQDYPDEKVDFVLAHAIRKWLAPIESVKSSKQ